MSAKRSQFYGYIAMHYCIVSPFLIYSHLGTTQISEMNAELVELQGRYHAYYKGEREPFRSAPASAKALDKSYTLFLIYMHTESPPCAMSRISESVHDLSPHKEDIRRVVRRDH